MPLQIYHSFGNIVPLLMLYSTKVIGEDSTTSFANMFSFQVI